MARTLEMLKKSLLAGLVLTMLVLSVVVPVLDSELVGAEPHFDGAQDQSCPLYGHNHAVCVVFAANAVHTTQARRQEFGATAVIAHSIPESDLDPARILAGVHRSRGPPRA
ncbi:MAG: hypothetical protein ACRELX_13860 [Longimicrobiales bacterium]